VAFSGNTETVIFRYAPTLDTYGDPIVGSGGDVSVEGCLFAPGATSENLAQANQASSEATLYAPEDAPKISPKDQIVVRGDVYAIVGRPKLWLGEGFEILLRFVTG
jgi:hypothetical protein